MTNNTTNTNTTNTTNTTSTSATNAVPNANNPYITNTTTTTGVQNGFAQNAFNTTTQTTQTTQTNNSLFGSTTQRDFILGAVIGAAASFILTNENAQKAILKGFAKVTSLFEMGIEEIKERYEDAKAEVNA